MCVTLELLVVLRVTCACAANGARSAAVVEHHYMDSSVLSVVSVC